MMKILIVKLSALGDMIHVFPVLNYLYSLYPEAQIDWVVEKPYKELISSHPFVNRQLLVDTKKWRKDFLSRQNWQEFFQFREALQEHYYDVVLDLQGNVKSAIVTQLANGKTKVGFGVKTAPEWPNALATHKRFNPPKGNNIRQDYLFLAQSAFNCFVDVPASSLSLHLTETEKQQLKPMQAFASQMQHKKIMVCPGSNWQNKQLSEDTLQEFLQLIAANKDVYFFFVWGNPAEQNSVEKLAAKFTENSVVVQKSSLPILQNLMGQMDVVIAMDSLALHLAATANTPTFSVFGPSSARKYKPLGLYHKAYQGSCPYGKTFDKRCEVLRTCKSGACMKQLTAQQLYSYFLANCLRNSNSPDVK